MNRTIIVGDIHGCYDELMLLLAKLHLQPNDLLIALGDIVDRGNKSLEVYQYLRERPNTVVLMGNHERKHLQGILSYSQEIVQLQFGTAYPAFLEWLKGLPYYYTTPEAIIVHASLLDGMPLEEQREEVLCGTISGEKQLEKAYGNSMEWMQHYKGDKPVIFGHRVVNEVEITGNCWGIDTGCCHGRQLTAIELPGMRIHQVDGLANHWRAEQKKWQLPVLYSRNWKQMEFKAIRHQLKKLDYLQEPEARQILDQVHHWVVSLPQTWQLLTSAIEQFAASIQADENRNFVQEANQYFFKVFLYKANANNLKISDLEQSLQTPEKVLKLADALQANILSFPE
ncbi:MAG: metallophosphoesterase [Chitinophaga sp.]|uniref:metallophosphoesterase n=1 Tax=Chitinophaga sp. TaxID=1869181 RepID=UPI0025C6876E|nr:metallophosphoesterase [Chitinophaga sp.]MBV8253687.1 metallophosphoesterase [Chitinophaga sp.]